MYAKKLIQRLQLERHPEGGYFKRTFEATERERIHTPAGERLTMTSIYYMLTNDSAIGHWHLNISDIMHYFHAGNPIEYTLIHPDGHLSQFTLGGDIVQGQQYQAAVPGGVWKTSRLLNGNCDFGLISEAVSPGFEFDDMQLANASELSKVFPQHKDILHKYALPKESNDEQ